ncbi:GNAT family N-acetyltransferase [Streptomyces olivoreticuli]
MSGQAPCDEDVIANARLFAELLALTYLRLVVEHAGFSDCPWLSAPSPRDADAVHTACQDTDIQHYMPMASPFDREDTDRYVTETASQGWSTDRDYILGAFCKDDGALVGSFCLTRISLGVYELGYWADSRQRGQGHSAEAGMSVTTAPRMRWRYALPGGGDERAAPGSPGRRPVACRLRASSWVPAFERDRAKAGTPPPGIDHSQRGDVPPLTLPSDINDLLSNILGCLVGFVCDAAVISALDWSTRGGRHARHGHRHVG